MRMKALRQELLSKAQADAVSQSRTFGFGNPVARVYMGRLPPLGLSVGFERGIEREAREREARERGERERRERDNRSRALLLLVLVRVEVRTERNKRGTREMRDKKQTSSSSSSRTRTL